MYLESNHRKPMYHIQMSNGMINGCLIRNNGGQKTLEVHTQTTERRNSGNQETDIQQNYPSKVK